MEQLVTFDHSKVIEIKQIGRIIFGPFVLLQTANTRIMNTAELVYQGELRTLAKHVYSGTTLFTDAPLDNHGKAQSFSPTDMVAVALASCIITTIGILMKEDHLPLKDTQLAVRKIMASNPRRIAAIEVDIDVSAEGLSDAQKERMKEIAHTCPVAKSLHPDLDQRVVLRFK